MKADIIPLPSTRPRPACALTADIAYRVMKLYEAAIGLCFRAEIHAATGAHRRALLCRRAVSRLRRLAFSCLLTNLSKDELPHFTDQLYRGHPPRGAVVAAMPVMPRPARHVATPQLQERL